VVLVVFLGCVWVWGGCVGVGILIVASKGGGVERVGEKGEEGGRGVSEQRQSEWERMG
jgi:hypothetical protein